MTEALVNIAAIALAAVGATFWFNLGISYLAECRERKEAERERGFSPERKAYIEGQLNREVHRG